MQLKDKEAKMKEAEMKEAEMKEAEKKDQALVISLLHRVSIKS